MIATPAPTPTLFILPTLEPSPTATNTPTPTATITASPTLEPSPTATGTSTDAAITATSAPSDTAATPETVLPVDPAKIPDGALFPSGGSTNTVMAWSLFGTALAVGDTIGGANVWFESGDVSLIFPEFDKSKQHSITAIALNRDNEVLLTGYENGDVQVLQMGFGYLQVSEHFDGPIRLATWGLNSDFFVISNRSQTMVYSINREKVLLTIPEPAASVRWIHSYSGFVAQLASDTV
jgi:hypothetical protein